MLRKAMMFDELQTKKPLVKKKLRKAPKMTKSGKKLTTANGLGIAVIFVLTFTAPLNWLIQENILKEGALVKYFGEQYATVNLDFLQLLMFIAVIASFVQFVEMVIEKFSPTLYGSLGIFLSKGSHNSVRVRYFSFCLSNPNWFGAVMENDAQTSALLFLASR